MRIHGPCTACEVIGLDGQGKLGHYLVQSEEIFQTVPYSVKETQEKGKRKRKVMLTRKSP